MDKTLANFTDLLDDEICESQPLSLPSSSDSNSKEIVANNNTTELTRGGTGRPCKGNGKHGYFRSTEEIDVKYRDVFTYPYFNLVQSKVIDDALYSDKSIVVCAPTGSGKTVIFEMAIVQLLMELEDKNYTEDFKIIYMAPVKALCTERLTEWYPKFTKLGLMCIEATGDTDIDFSQLQPYKIIITTPEKWDMLTRRWRDHRNLVEVIKLFLIDEVHILNDETRGPVLEAVVSRMKTIESSAQSVYRIEQLQNQLHGSAITHKTAPNIRFVAVSATVSNPEDVAEWLGSSTKPAVFHKFGDECRPVKLNRIVEGYPCPPGTSIFKFDIILNYKLWPIIQKYHCGKPTLIFCNTRKSVSLTAETLSRELTINVNAEQKAKLTALASTIKNKKLQSLVMNGVGCHHAGLLYEERQTIELAFRNRDLPILITTTTLAMGVNLPAHLVIIKNTQQYVKGAFQEYSISTVLQMVGRAGRPQFDTDATAVIMTRLSDKGRYQALVGGCEPLQSYLHKRLPENLNSEAALGTVTDVAQCVQWLRSTFLHVRAARDPRKYLGLQQNSPPHQISKKIEELCVKAMNGLASSGLITMDEASCIESTEAGRLMSIYYLDAETMKLLMKIEGTETLERLLTLLCESHELSDMHLRMDERRCLNALNRNNAAATIRFPMKGKISTRQMKLNCIIQAVLGCLAIPDPSLNQEAMKIMRTVDRVCKCLVSYVTRPDLISRQPEFYLAVLNSIVLAKCIAAHLWENSPYVSKQLKGIGPTFSTLLATAGKVSFMLLEESHPRDLERIMNKGAPAGNVLRRQILLLPKYQLSMTPVDDSTVVVQLDLLNKSFLLENIEQLTAGQTHKCYFVVGDSTNHLLLLTSFKDTDLLRVFDGTITHEIRRRHNFEHKIYAHCISTSFVGIDVQSEYVFIDLNKFFEPPHTNKNESFMTDTIMTQNKTFKKRKRKNNDDSDIPQSKEKKKRENSFIKNFKYIKNVVETASKNVRGNMNSFAKERMLPNKDIVALPESEMEEKGELHDKFNRIRLDTNVIENIDSDDFIDNDDKIDNLLTEIEYEMSKRKTNTNSLCASSIKELNGGRGSLLSKYQTMNTTVCQTKSKLHESIRSKLNYPIIDLVTSDNDDKTVSAKKENGFSDTIKSHINKYIQKTKFETSSRDPSLQLLLVNEDNTRSDHNKDSNNEFMDLNREVVSTTSQFEIKEINEPESLTDKKEKPEEIQCTVISSKESAVKRLSNSDTNYVSTLDAIKEIDLLNDNQTKSKTLFASKENLNTPTVQLGNPKSNSDDDYEKSIEFQANTNDLVDVLEKKTNKSYDCQKENIDTSNKIDVTPVKLCVKGTDSNDVNLKPVCATSSNKKYEFNRINFERNITKQDPREKNIYNNCLSLAELPNKDSYINNETQAMIPKPYTSIHCNGSKLLNDSILSNSSDRQMVSDPVCANNYRIVNIMDSCRSSNNLVSKNNEKAFAKNYSFSTTKVDIETKQTSEYSIRVIKEIKMDWNITEIVSSNQRKQNNNPQSQNIKSQNIKTLVNNGHKKLSDINRQNFSLSDQSLIGCTELVRSKDLKKQDVQNFQILNSSSTTIENTRDRFGEPDDTNSINDNCFKSTISDIHPGTTENMESTNTVNDTHKINNIQELLDRDNVEDSNGSNNVFELSKDTENIVKTETHDVQNILEKYSKILGKDTNKDQPTVYSTTSKNMTDKKSLPKSLPKFLKPFKISEINKLQATVPETVINYCKQGVDKLGSAKILNNESEIKKYANVEFDLPNFNENSTNDCSIYNNITKMDLEPIHTPVEMDLEPDIDCNLDQSMLNPKTLLQCTVEASNEDVIAPPPEFCDFYIDSRHQSDDEESNTTNNCNQFDTSQFDYNTCNDFYDSESIFEDNSTTKLTPSREIETWTLDKQDCLEEQNSSLSSSPMKCFTVMRRNNSNCNILENKAMTMSRQAKLKKFHFTHKNKFRKWK